MGAVPWHRSPKAVWISVGAAAVVLAVGLFLFKRSHDDDALFRRAMSNDFDEFEAARAQILANPSRYTARLSTMLEPGSKAEASVAVNILDYLELNDDGARWLHGVTRSGEPYRRVYAALLLWSHRREEKRVLEVFEDALKEGDIKLETLILSRLSTVRIDPEHDRLAAGIALRFAEDLHREGRVVESAERTHVEFATRLWLHAWGPYAKSLLEARAASPEAMPWHREMLEILADPKRRSELEIREVPADSK